MTVNDQDPYSVEARTPIPEETSEWAGIPRRARRGEGHQRAREIMLSLLKRSKELHLGVPMVPTTDYINTIAPENEPEFPGDEEIERRYRAWIRWNAAIMVHRAQRPGIARRRPHLDLRVVRRPLRGGPQPLLPRPGPPRRRRPDLLPGPRLPRHVRPRVPRGPPERPTSSTASARRSRTRRTACSSYPHPRLMPEFWEFPTVSMGLGPINAIYQAQLNRYLHQPRHQGRLRPARLGVPRRRRDGRGREPRRSCRWPRTRARQPHLRHQLQPAAPRRPGARQRQDHPGARELLPRRRLERHQGRLGPRVGRPARRATTTARSST